MAGRHCALVALVAILLYAGTIRFDFVYDDAGVVSRHTLVTGEDWGRIFTSPYHVGPDVRVPTGAYRPLTIASLAVNYRISGLAPWSYHLLNVVLHGLAAVLLLWLGVELGLSSAASLSGALAFAVHPVHVEAVANVAGRAELLSSVLALACLIAAARGRLVASAVFLAAGMFAKENVVTIAGVIALGWALGPIRRRGALPTLAAVSIPVGVYLAARLAVLGHLGIEPGTVSAIENPTLGLPPGPHAATVLAVFARAVSLAVTPIRLSPDYGFAEIRPSASFADPGALVGAALLCALAGLIAWCWRRAPVVAFLLGSIVLTYAIVSNAFIPIGTVLGDRLLYLPSAFICILFGLGALAVARRFGKPAGVAMVAVILVALTARTVTYARVWKNDATLFAYAARVAPQSVRALGGWGRILGEQGRVSEARAVLDRAVALAPDFIPTRLNRGAAALAAGDLDTAEADARHVLAISPDDPVARRQLAAILQARGP